MNAGGNALRALGVAAVAAALGGCPSTRGPRALTPDGTGAVEAPPPCDRPYYEGTEVERKRLADLVASLATAKGPEVLEVEKAIACRGEPAVPLLIEALKGPTPAQRGAAAYLLGVLKDRRAVEALVAATADAVPAVRYEAAAALLEVQDPRGLAVLVDGLADPDVRRRGKCVDVLAERTGQTLGYEADGAPEDRAAAIARWRAWLAARPARGG